MMQNWQADNKLRAFAGFTFNRNIAAVNFDHPAHHGQPQPGTLGIGGEERVEYLFQVLAVDAESGITYGKVEFVLHHLPGETDT